MQAANALVGLRFCAGLHEHSSLDRECDTCQNLICWLIKYFLKVLLDLWGIFDTTETVKSISLTLHLIETPFDGFANRAEPDQAALVRAA